MHNEQRRGLLKLGGKEGILPKIEFESATVIRKNKGVLCTSLSTQGIKWVGRRERVSSICSIFACMSIRTVIYEDPRVEIARHT